MKFAKEIFCIYLRRNIKIGRILFCFQNHVDDVKKEMGYKVDFFSNSCPFFKLFFKLLYIPKDGSHMKRRFALSKEEEEALNNAVKENWNNNSAQNGRLATYTDSKCDINSKNVPNGFNNNDPNAFANKSKYAIPTKNVSNVESNALTNGESKSLQSNVINTVNGEKRPERPTQLSLAPGDNFNFHGGHGTQMLGSSPTTPSQPSQPQSPSGQLSPILLDRCVIFCLY